MKSQRQVQEASSSSSSSSSGVAVRPSKSPSPPLVPAVEKARPAVAKARPSRRAPIEAPTPPPPPTVPPLEMSRRAPGHRQLAPQQPEQPPLPEMLGGRGVTRGNEELGGPSGMCPQCRVPRSSCFRLGDWACPLCGQHNYPSKFICTNYRCKARKGVSVPSAPTPGQLPAPSSPTTWCDSCRRPRSECWKPNDWECPYCKNHNYARKQVSQQRVCVCMCRRVAVLYGSCITCLFSS